MGSPLKDIVRLGGLALQAEDCTIRAAVHHRGEHGGLVRAENERFHQFVIWRAILPIYHAVLERENFTDIVLQKEDQRHYFELKNWRRETIPSIQHDIDRKLSRWRNGYALVTSCNPHGMTAENVSILNRSLRGIDIDEQQIYAFDTENTKGDKFDFWLIGWPTIKEEVS